MEIDFYQDYKNLPLPELVKVARSPWDYLPEAVTAAELVLKERGISAEEIAVEEWNLAQKEMSDALARRRFGDYFNWFWELLPSASEDAAPRPWIYVFLLVYAIYYVCNVYSEIKLIVFFSRCEICRDTGLVTLSALLVFAFLTTTLLLLLKQKPLGWSLVFVHFVVASFVNFFHLFRLFARHDFFPLALSTYLLPLVIGAAVLIFLLRPFVQEFFGVRPKYRDITVLVAILLGIVKLIMP